MRNSARNDAARHVSKIRLNGSADGDQPIGLGDAVIVSGWGKTEDRDDAPTNGHLDWVKIHAVDCAWGVYKGKTTADNLCAYGKGQDACQGDSGGPLIRAGGEPVLVGIVSWGIDCGKNAGVYVRIDRDHYLDWINRTISDAGTDRTGELEIVAATAPVAAATAVATAAPIAATASVTAASAIAAAATVAAALAGVLQLILQFGEIVLA